MVKPFQATEDCDTCNLNCNKPRPEGCVHDCPKPCHLGSCLPCKQMLRIKCHCGLNQPYVVCEDWSFAENKEQLQSCGNQCPSNVCNQYNASIYVLVLVNCLLVFY